MKKNFILNENMLGITYFVAKLMMIGLDVNLVWKYNNAFFFLEF